MVIPCKENSLGAINGYSGSSYQDFSPLWREDTFIVVKGGAVAVSHC